MTNLRAKHRDPRMSPRRESHTHRWSILIRIYCKLPRLIHSQDIQAHLAVLVGVLVDVPLVYLLNQSQILRVDPHRSHDF